MASSARLSISGDSFNRSLRRRRLQSGVPKTAGGTTGPKLHDFFRAKKLPTGGMRSALPQGNFRGGFETDVPPYVTLPDASADSFSALVVGRTEMRHHAALRL